MQHFIPTILTRYDLQNNNTISTDRCFMVVVFDDCDDSIRISDRTEIEFPKTAKTGIYKTDANLRQHPFFEKVTHVVVDFSTKTVTICTEEQINQLMNI